jgi:hypothetical protein
VAEAVAPRAEAILTPDFAVVTCGSFAPRLQRKGRSMAPDQGRALLSITLPEDVELPPLLPQLTVDGETWELDTKSSPEPGGPVNTFTWTFKRPEPA